MAKKATQATKAKAGAILGTALGALVGNRQWRLTSAERAPLRPAPFVPPKGKRRGR